MSGNTSGALGFVQGLQGGMDHADKRRRNKAIDNILDRDAHEKDLDYASRKLEYENAGGNVDEFPEFDNPAEKDPFLVRGFNWLKGKFGQGNAKDGVELATPTQDEAQITPTAIPAPGASGGSGGDHGMGAVDLGSGFKMADGGEVDEDRMARSYGEYYVSEEEAAENRAARSRGEHRNRNPYNQRYAAGVDRQGLYNDNTGGGFGEAVNDIKRAAIPAFDDTINAATEGQADVDAANQGFSDARGARETGTAARKVVGAHIRHKGATAIGVAKDAADAIVDNPVSQALLGFVGFDGTQENRQPDPDTPAPKAMSSKEDSPKAAALDAAVGTQESDESVAAKAVDAGVNNNPGHPDHPDQAFDWAEVAAQNVNPDEIPHVGVKDWAEHRRRAGKAAALRGESNESAQMAVTKMQMQGAQSNFMQAAFLLRSGNQRGAALAARAAFQYFPNGSDVRLGTMDGENGPVLIGYGVDEETGEPVMEGKPMILTPEAMAVMAENFSNPSAFRTWTKDWHEMEQARREYEEVEKPEAQSNAIYRDRMGQAAVNNSNAALSRAANAGSGGVDVKESDFRASFESQSEQLFMLGLEEEDLGRLETIANRIRQAVPSQSQISDSQIVGIVMRFAETEDPTEIQTYLQPQGQ